MVRCDDWGVFLCRGTNQQRPMIYCPSCRQTLSRSTFDTYLVNRLLIERGGERLQGKTLRERWLEAGTREEVRRELLLSQLASLRTRRGVVGRYFEEARVLLVWNPSDADLTPQE